MQKFILLLLFCGITFVNQAQNASVEQSIYGIQTGLLGIWVHNESRLSNTIALRSEIGFDGGILVNPFYDDISGYAATPVFTVSPRCYYNIKDAHENQGVLTGTAQILFP